MINADANIVTAEE